jgi:hypothetical protein
MKTKIIEYYKALNRKFEINLGWIFVNGRKIDRWNKYLKDTYDI